MPILDKKRLLTFAVEGLPMVEWVFFDVGSVLVNDDLQSFFAYLRYYEALQQRRPEYTFAQMLAEREALLQQDAQKGWVLQRLVSQYLSEEEFYAIFQQLRQDMLPRFDELNRWHREVKDVIQQAKADYHLGIIANQPAECRASLARHGLLDHFQVMAISEEIDLYKPDLALYRWAVTQAGAVPDRCVMIGDRLDNDIAPAKALGMKTIWLRWPNCAARAWEPTNEHEKLFADSLDRCPQFRSPLTAENAPDITIEHLNEIPAALAQLRVC